MALPLTLPALEPHPAHPPETRPARVNAWIASLGSRDPVEVARALADALATTSRISLADARRFEVAECYWAAAESLWALLERRFAQVAHPLAGEALASAKATLALSGELSIAYKHLLAREADRRIVIGGARRAALLVQRCLQSIARTVTSSYLAYSPVPAHTWLDAHRIYAFAYDRGVHRHASTAADPERTPERTYVELLLVALANPYGLAPGLLGSVTRYVQAHAQLAKLTDVQPVHRMAKAVAIIPVGHDFPPFSAHKGGAIEGRKMFLLTYDLAFQMQEELRALDAGAAPPAGVGADAVSRRAHTALVRRLLRQWAIPPARQINRVPSRAPVTTCTGLANISAYLDCMLGATAGSASRMPVMTRCEVVNHTPGGYALRQTDPRPSPLRIAELVAVAIQDRGALHVAIVRWFRNTLHGSALEFGCELMSDAPILARAAPEHDPAAAQVPALVLPQQSAASDAPLRVILPAEAFHLEQAITLQQNGASGFAVLTKLLEQGPGFELYEFVAVE